MRNIGMPKPKQVLGGDAPPFTVVQRHPWPVVTLRDAVDGNRRSFCRREAIQAFHLVRRGYEQCTVYPTLHRGLDEVGFTVDVVVGVVDDTTHGLDGNIRQPGDIFEGWHA